MSSEGSDMEMKSTLPKKVTKKMPKSPSAELLEKKQEKKLTTKSMISQALIDLKSRKGVSLYAIKKYLSEKYNFETEKNNYLIKKSIKSAIEDGTIIQTKGMGVTGSFKLVPGKEKKKTKPKKKIEKQLKDRNPKEKNDEAKEKMTTDKLKKTQKINATKTKNPKKTDEKSTKSKKKDDVEKVKKIIKQVKDGADGGKKNKMKVAKEIQTPAKKKAAMIKRKSIGSIIKPPKMKPQVKA